MRPPTLPVAAGLAEFVSSSAMALVRCGPWFCSSAHHCHLPPPRPLKDQGEHVQCDAPNVIEKVLLSLYDGLLPGSVSLSSNEA